MRTAAPTGIRRSRSRSSSCTARPPIAATSTLADKLTSRRGFGFFAGGRFDLPYYQDAEPVRGISLDRRPRRARALPRRRGDRSLRRDRRRGRCSRRCSRSGTTSSRRRLYLTGGIGSRHYDEAIGDPYELPPDRAYCETCAADREHHVELAAAAGHRREPVRRPDRADALQRLPRRALARRSVVLLREPAAVAQRRHAPCLEPGRLLPAEHHAPARLSAPLPRHDQRRRRAAPSVRDIDDPCRRAGCGPRRARGRDGLPVVGLSDGGGGRVRRRGVDALAPGAGVGARRAPRRRSRSRRDTRSSRAAGARATASSWSSTSRPGSRRRIRGSMRFVAALPSSAGRSSTASRPTTSPPAPTSPRSRSRGRPSLPTAVRWRRSAACRACPSQGVVRDLDGWAQIEYVDVRELPPDDAAAPARLLAVPYFAWANRGGGGMRVWVPRSG